MKKQRESEKNNPELTDIDSVQMRPWSVREE